MKRLEKKNIPVIILSRNEAIISSPNMFKELLGNIGIRINDNQLHCCYYDKKTKKKIFSSKYNYMKDYLPEICL